MASADLNALFQDALSFSSQMLKTHSGFIPFGVAMDANGQIAYVGSDVGSENASAVDVIELLQTHFARQAREGSIRAAAVCLEARAVPPGGVEKVDVVCVRLAHTSGEALVVLAPYALLADGAMKLGQVWSASSSPFKLAVT